MAQNGQITIHDIARRTGLSKGTVDRVLHDRGGVSRKSKEKVMAAIQELGYEPNVYASLLAKGQRHLVAVLIPAAYLLSLTGKLELVWLAFPIAEVVSLLFSAVFLRRTYRQTGISVKRVPMPEQTGIAGKADGTA